MVEAAAHCGHSAPQPMLDTDRWQSAERAQNGASNSLAEKQIETWPGCGNTHTREGRWDRRKLWRTWNAPLCGLLFPGRRTPKKGMREVRQVGLTFAA